MAGSLSDYAENKVLDLLFSNTSYTIPTTYYIGLWTSALSDASTGSTAGEVSGGSYARVAVTNNVTNFPASSSGAKTNGVTFTFPTASAGWGTITHLGLFDASSAGNMIAWTDLGTSKTIANGDTASINGGDLALSIT